MSTRTTTILSLTLILISMLVGTMLWNQMPEQMASHWNVQNQADGYSSRFIGLFLLPLTTLGLFALFMFIPRIDPLKANIAQFIGVFNLFITFFVVFMLYIHALTIIWNLGNQNFAMSQAMLPFIGLLFILIGFMLRQAKRNWFIGIRTPWTLSSDRVWDETHHLGAPLFMASGGLALLGAFFSGTVAFWLMFVPLIGSTIFLVIYSYVLYQREMKG